MTRVRILSIILVFVSCAFARAATLLWTNATGFAIQASPAVAPDGTIYVGSYDRFVYALTPTGGTNWRTELPPPTYIYFNTYSAVYGTPAIGADGTIYVPSENGHLLAIDPTNGVIRWTYSTPARDGLYSSPAIGADGTIYFGSYDKSLYAINPDGTKKWSSRFASTIFTSPVVGPDGTVYCGADDGKIYALAPADGATNWIFTTGISPISASPAIGTNGTLYVGINATANPTFYSINANGTTNWIFTAGSRIRSSAAIAADGTIYFGCQDHKLYALNPDGTKKWDFTAGSSIGSSPAIAANGTIIFGCDDRKLYAIDANGNQLWTFRTGDHVFASPAIGRNGTICFASDDGALYVVKGCEPPMISDWPMHRRDLNRVGSAAIASTNRPPVLGPIADRTIAGGDALNITNSALDPDGAAQELTFTLGIDAPYGATIDPTNGTFTWIPSQAYVPSTNLITVTVMDNGSPPLSDVQCFTVVVGVPAPPPYIQSIAVLNANVTLTWQAIPLRTYRVQYKTNLNETAWNNLGDVTATNNTAMKEDPVGTAAQQRFYRVELLP